MRSLMKRLSDWWYILKVCRKYKIFLWPFGRKGEGTYWKYNFWTGLTTIRVNPFDKHLMEIFLHEVGHHVAGRLGWLERYIKYLEDTPKDQRILARGKSYYILLQEEAFASRFAGKVSKELDTAQLVKWFQTYVHSGYKTPYIKDKVAFTDYVYKLIRRIESV